MGSEEIPGVPFVLALFIGHARSVDVAPDRYRADNHRIHILVAVQFFIVHAGLDIVFEFLFEVLLSFLTTQLPDIGDRDDVEVQFLVVVHEAGQERLPEAVGKAHHAYLHAVVGTHDASIALCTETHRAEIYSGSGPGCLVDELPAGRYEISLRFEV